MGVLTNFGIAAYLVPAFTVMFAFEYQVLKRIIALDMEQYERDFPKQFYAQQQFFSEKKEQLGRCLMGHVSKLG